MNVIITSIDYILNWSRANSLWPLTFATSCCAIEMMQTVANHGYWGTESGFGSLQALKARLKDAEIMTDEELAMMVWLLPLLNTLFGHSVIRWINVHSIMYTIH